MSARQGRRPAARLDVRGQAKAAAGDDNVVLMAGLVPLLFDAETGKHVKLERTATPNATHLTFRVLN